MGRWDILYMYRIQPKQIPTMQNFKVSAVKSNATIEVFTYLGREERMRSLAEECLPSSAYKRVIVDGAIEHDLPTEYIERLKLIEDNGYMGEVDLSISSA